MQWPELRLLGKARLDFGCGLGDNVNKVFYGHGLGWITAFV